MNGVHVKSGYDSAFTLKHKETRMKRLFAGCLVMMLLLTATSLYAKPKSVAGMWTLVVTEQGSYPMVLEQKGKTVSGSIDGPHGLIQLKGEFTNGQLKVDGTSQAIQLSATGSLKSDGSLAGNMKSNVGDMAWTAIRAKQK
jgi:hypothetical protein